MSLSQFLLQHLDFRAQTLVYIQKKEIKKKEIKKKRMAHSFLVQWLTLVAVL